MNYNERDLLLKINQTKAIRQRKDESTHIKQKKLQRRNSSKILQFTKSDW